MVAHPRPLRSYLRTAVRLVAQVGLLALVAAAFFVRMPQVTGFSMAPHIASGEVVVIDTLSYRLRGPKRGDIVAFRHERGGADVYLKRVIAIAGDRVGVDRGVVSVNGIALVEPYVRFRDRRSEPNEVVPPGALYVLGDNRANSDDSRDWGFVHDEDVIGRALFGIWPLSRIGPL